VRSAGYDWRADGMEAKPDDRYRYYFKGKDPTLGSVKRFFNFRPKAENF
jgi:hypothetical protein